MEPIPFEQKIPASYILDWLKRYFADWPDPVAYGQKYCLAIDPADTAIAQELRGWYEDGMQDKRHFPQGLPGPEVLGDPRNRVFLNKPKWNTANGRTTIVCNGGASIWHNTLPLPWGPYLDRVVVIEVQGLAASRSRLTIQGASPTIAGFVARLADAFRDTYGEKGRTTKKRTGAPRVQDRDDWPDKKKKSYEYERKKRDSGQTVASDLAGYSKTTLEHWLKLAKEEDAESVKSVKSK